MGPGFCVAFLALVENSAAEGGRRRSGAWAIGPGPGTGRAEYLQFAQSVRMLLEEMEDE